MRQWLVPNRIGSKIESMLWHWKVLLEKFQHLSVELFSSPKQAELRNNCPHATWHYFYWWKIELWAKFFQDYLFNTKISTNLGSTDNNERFSVLMAFEIISVMTFLTPWFFLNFRSSITNRKLKIETGLFSGILTLRILEPFSGSRWEQSRILAGISSTLRESNLWCVGGTCCERP